MNLPADWFDELDTLALAIARPGTVYSRADVMRIALRMGMDRIKEELAKAKP